MNKLPIFFHAQQPFSCIELHSDPGGYHFLSYTPVLSPITESTYSCICDGLELKLLHEDGVIKICTRNCQSPNLNSANIYFWPLGGHFAKYNSSQIFRLYGMYLA